MAHAVKTTTIQEARSIKAALDYLTEASRKAKLPFAAHLISVAAMAVGDAIEMASGIEKSEGRARQQVSPLRRSAPRRVALSR